jgi:cytochrome c556
MRPGSIALGAASLAVAIGCLGAPTRAAEKLNAEDMGTIKYRQSLMDAIGGHMSAIGDVVKYGLAYQDQVVRHAEMIEESAEMIAPAFERPVTQGPTDAKPKIWEKQDDFLQKAHALHDAAAQLAFIASSADPDTLAKQVKALGKACGDCHDSYRKPKEESYKLKMHGPGGE